MALFSGRTQKEKDRLAEAMTYDVCKLLKLRKRRYYYLSYFI